MTKKRAREIQENKERIERNQERERQRQKKIIEDFKKAEEARNRKIINKIYENIRFFIRTDGTAYTWGRNYANPYTRLNRENHMELIPNIVNEEINSNIN